MDNKHRPNFSSATPLRFTHVNIIHIVYTKYICSFHFPVKNSRLVTFSLCPNSCYVYIRIKATTSENFCLCDCDCVEIFSAGNSRAFLQYMFCPCLCYCDNNRIHTKICCMTKYSTKRMLSRERHNLQFIFRVRRFESIWLHVFNEESTFILGEVTFVRFNFYSVCYQCAENGCKTQENVCFCVDFSKLTSTMNTTPKHVKKF